MFAKCLRKEFESTYMGLIHSYLQGKLTEKNFSKLLDLLEVRQLEEGFHLTNTDQKTQGVYFLPATNVSVLGHKVAKRETGTIAATGLQELILNESAKLDLVINSPVSASFLPAEVFYDLLQQSDWFPDTLLKIMASEEGLDFTSTHFIQEEKNLKLEKLVEASRILNSTLDLNQLLNVILDTSLNSVNGDRGTVYLIDYDKKELWSKVLDGSQKVKITLPIGKGIAGYVAETGETVNIADAHNDPRFNPEIDKKTGYLTQTILCMPLKNKEGKILGVFQLLNKLSGVFTHDDEQFIESLSIHAAIAIENARLYEQEQKKIAMEKEMLAAGEVQRSLFPTSMPQVAGYEIYAHNIPAQLVSGDLFDCISLDDSNICFTLGDVSGKGLPAAILMANMQSVMRDLPHHNPSPMYCVDRINKMIFRSSGFDKFITLFLGHLDIENNRLTFANAGHDYPYLFRSTGATERLESTGIPIGMMEMSTYVETTIDLEPGDLLFVYSDGVIDAVNASSKEFTEERMSELAYAHRSKSPREITEIIEKELLSFIGNTPQFDDMTMLVLKRL